MVAAAVALALGFRGLFFPPMSEGPALLAWAAALLVLTYLAYSVLSVLHQAWGARLGGDEGQRARNEQIAILVQQFRRHGCQTPAMKEVHEKGFQNVVAMVPEHNGRAALLTRNAVKVPTTQPRTQAAHRATGRDF